MWTEQGLNKPAAHQLIPLLVLGKDNSPPSWWTLGSQHMCREGLVELLTPGQGQGPMLLHWGGCPVLRTSLQQRTSELANSVAASKPLFIYLCNDICTTPCMSLPNSLHCLPPPLSFDLQRTMVPTAKPWFLGILQKVLQHLAVEKTPYTTLHTIRALHRHWTVCPLNTNLDSFIILLT